MHVGQLHHWQDEPASERQCESTAQQCREQREADRHAKTRTQQALSGTFEQTWQRHRCKQRERRRQQQRGDEHCRRPALMQARHQCERAEIEQAMQQ